MEGCTQRIKSGIVVESKNLLGRIRYLLLTNNLLFFSYIYEWMESFKVILITSLKELLVFSDNLLSLLTWAESSWCLHSQVNVVCE